MKKFIFSGHNNDTFGEYNETEMDYNNGGSGKPIKFALITPEGKGIIIVGLYGSALNAGAVWMIGVEAFDDTNPVDWDIKLYPSYDGYRNKLVVIAPDDAILGCANQMEDAVKANG